MSRSTTVVCCLLMLSTLAACRRETTAQSPSSSPPAKVAAPVAESSLNTLTLSSDAQKRLGIETGRAERQKIARSRTLGGEIQPAGGAQITVTSPVAGTLADTSAPAVGSLVTKGQTILSLVPLAPAERDVRIESERAVTEAAGRQEMAAKRAARARQLVQDGSGSQRAAEEAQADLVAADAALKAARDRFTLASRDVSPSGAITLVAPQSAVLLALHAKPGQRVGSGAPLFDLVALESVWVRVPVYAGDLDAIDRRASIEVGPLGAPSSAEGMKAVPVVAPPTADPSSAGVDLFYSVLNRDRALRPGQRVSVRIPLRASEESLVVPRAAVLFDAFGGAWVYEARDNGVFVRHRIALADFIDGAAVLGQGPPVGTRVVTTGAAELFGTEFGVGK